MSFDPIEEWIGWKNLVLTIATVALAVPVFTGLIIAACLRELRSMRLTTEPRAGRELPSRLIP